MVCQVEMMQHTAAVQTHMEFTRLVANYVKKEVCKRRGVPWSVEVFLCQPRCVGPDAGTNVTKDVRVNRSAALT